MFKNKRRKELDEICSLRLQVAELESEKEDLRHENEMLRIELEAAKDQIEIAIKAKEDTQKLMDTFIGIDKLFH